jgi:hypothetical protein
MPEVEVVEPLSADEIKSGVVTKVCEAIWAAMDKTCNLYGVAYPKFSASGSIDFKLDNFGSTIEDRIQFSVEIDIKETPPNVFRRETGQGVPTVTTNDDGSVEQKAVIYKRPARKMGRAGSDVD